MALSTSAEDCHVLLLPGLSGLQAGPEFVNALHAAATSSLTAF